MQLTVGLTPNMPNGDLIGRAEWTKASFATAVRGAEAAGGVAIRRVEGEVKGYFGIDLREVEGGDEGPRRVWIATHLATGHRLPKEFAERADAVACVELMESLRCWEAGSVAQVLAHEDADRAKRILWGDPADGFTF